MNSYDSKDNKAYDTYLSVFLTGLLVVFVATYVHSIYLRKMEFSDHFHPGPDWPGTVIGPDVIDQSQFQTGNHYFGDLLMTILRSGEGTPYQPTRDLLASDYPPFAHVIYKPLVPVPYSVSIVLFLTVSLGLIVTPFILATSGKGFPKRLSFMSAGVLLTYPVLFALDRGNNILLAVGAILFGIYLFAKKRFLYAAVFFGLAASIKIYPVFFLLLFISRKQWRELIVSLSTGLTISALSLLMYEGGPLNNILTLWRTTGNFRDLDGQIHLNHSLYSFFVTVSQSDLGRISQFADIGARNYSLISIFMIIALAVVIVLLGSHLLEQLVLICCLNTLMIPLTYGYALSVFLVVILAMHLDDKETWRSHIFAVLVALLFLPKGFPIGPNGSQLLNYLNPSLQVAMLVVASTAVSGAVRQSLIKYPTASRRQ